MFAVGKPRPRPRWSPSTTSPSSRNGAPRHRIAPSTSPAATRARIRVEETVSPSTSTSGTTLVSNSSWAASISGSPRALRPKRKFSPTETFFASRRSSRICEQNCSASIPEKPSSKGMITSSFAPRPAITSRLISNGMISFGAASGWMTLSGWGSKVSTVSASSITARWPTWTPSKVPIATRRGRGSTSSRRATWIGESVPSAIGANSVTLERHDALQGLIEVEQGRRGGFVDRERPDRGAPQLDAIGVPGEIRDQAAHVGACRALDLELRPLLGPAQQLEAVDGDHTRRHLDLLAAPRAPVGALPSHLDGRMRRRALTDLSGRQLQVGGRQIAG